MTIFIIIAIVIVALGILIYFFYPQISTSLGFAEQNPTEFMQNCVEEEIKARVSVLSLQGGSLAPKHYILYNNEKIEYLCYTGEYYKTCVMQQPMLKAHIENEIKGSIAGTVENCFNDLKSSYEKQGYNVDLNQGEVSVELLPKRIVAELGSSMTLTKADAKNYDAFRVVVNNNLYELVSIANSILNWETHYGDAETTTYMNYYHDLKVEKKKQSDGTTIYILTDQNTGDKFQFASRSVAWPGGYGIKEPYVSPLTWRGVIEDE